MAESTTVQRMMRRLVAVAVVVGLAGSGCGGEAATCEELADETIDLAQTLIDDIEAGLDDASLEELLETGFELPAVESFTEMSVKIDERAAELGCTSAQMQQLVQSRIGDLSAETELGRLIIDGIGSGGI